jgi:glc operon protein GlcG
MNVAASTCAFARLLFAPCVVRRPPEPVACAQRFGPALTGPDEPEAEEALPMSRMLALACAFVLSAGTALAQQPAAPAPGAAPEAAPAAAPAPHPPYGPAITLDQAKRAMAAAELKAAENSWQVAITILDSGGNLVMFHKIDNAPLFAITVSQGKARTALDFKLPSKALDYAITAGGAGMRLLALGNTTPLEGGLPVVVDGKIVGAIGVAGALSPQDAEVAKAGADALVATQ